MTTNKLAVPVIEALRKGLPPQRGTQLYAVGHEKLMDGIKRFHLTGIEDKGIIRFISGSWGAGKTHFFRLMRELSFDQGCLVSNVELNVNEAPLNRFERVFYGILRNIITPTFFREYGQPQAAPFGIVLQEALTFLATGQHMLTDTATHENYTKAAEKLMACEALDIDFRKIVKKYWETFLPDNPDPVDQIMGAILRQVELPIPGASTGVRGLMDFLCETIENARTNDDAEFWDELSSNGKWDYSEALKSEGLYVAIRAWMTGDTDAQETVVDWLQNSANYRAQRKRLYEALVSGLRRHFRDPRPDYQFYQDGVFIFFHDGYRQSWDALQDTHLLLQKAGLKGFILLFDEFEDVLTASSMRIDHQEAAFWNLFRFFSGKKFEGMSFYAVTPGFVQKCKERLIEKDRFDFDYSRFDHLPTFAMSPLSERELHELAGRIIAAHALAYGYQADSGTVAAVRHVVERAARSPVQDRARHTIREVAAKLDTLMDL